MTHELKEDFPMLRLHKSIEAYRIVAAFKTVPQSQRLEIGLAHAPNSQPKTERQRGLRQAFFNRTHGHTLAELNAMSFDPVLLEPEYETGPGQGGDEFVNLVRRTQERLTKREIIREFSAALQAGYEPVLPRCREGPSLYEATTELGNWNLTTHFDFGGEFQFDCRFSLRHQKSNESVIFTPARLFGFGDLLQWDDVTRATLEQDATKALHMCLAIRAFIKSIVTEANL
jgi:hypothetical protein